jgi:hypothetical protein
VFLIGFLGAGVIDQIVVGRRRGIGGIYPNRNFIKIQWVEVDGGKRRRWCGLNRRRGRGGPEEGDGHERGA